MAKETDLGEFDFDDDLNFDLEGEFGLNSAEPSDAKDRTPVERNIVDFKKGFGEGFGFGDGGEDKLTILKKIAMHSLPSSLETEGTELSGIYDTYKQEVGIAGREMKRGAKGIVRTFERFIPKGSKAEKYANILKEKLGLNEEERQTNYSNDAKLAYDEVTRDLGDNTNKPSARELIEKSIEAKRSQTALVLAATTAANVEQVNAFNTQVANAYFRKSLELQYRSLYQGREQLLVTKDAFQTFRNQFESIIKNTSLPDIVKTNRSELLRQQINRVLADKLIGSRSVGDNIKRNLRDFIRGATGKVNDAAGMLESVSGQAEMLSGGGMEDFGITKGAMAGNFASDYAKEFIGKVFGSTLEKSKLGQSGISAVKDMFLDPSEYAKQMAEKNSGVLSKVFSTISDFTANPISRTDIDLSRGNMNEATSFDKRSHASLNKVIPGLLSKILSGVEGIRTQQPQEEIRYDYEKDKFMKRSEMSTEFRRRLSNSMRGSGMFNYIDNIYKLLKETTGLKITSDELTSFRKGFLEYIYAGKTLLPGRLKANGFYGYFPTKIASEVEASIDKLLNEKDFTKRNEYVSSLSSMMKSVRDSSPVTEDAFRKYADSGNMDILREEKLFKLNGDREEFNFDQVLNKHKQYADSAGFDPSLDQSLKKRFSGIRMNGNFITNFTNNVPKTNQLGQPFSPYTDYSTSDYYVDKSYLGKLKRQYTKYKKDGAAFVNKVNEGKLDESANALDKFMQTAKNTYEYAKDEEKSEVARVTKKILNDAQEAVDKAVDYGSGLKEEAVKTDGNAVDKMGAIFTKAKKDFDSNESMQETLSNLENKAEKNRDILKSKIEDIKEKASKTYEDKVSQDTRDTINDIKTNTQDSYKEAMGEISSFANNEDVRNKFFKTGKEKMDAARETVTDSAFKLNIKVFIGKVNKQLRTVQKFMDEEAAPINKKTIDSKIMTLRSKLERLSVSTDPLEIKEAMMKDIEIELANIVDSVIPQSAAYQKARKENEEHSGQEDIDEETSALFDIVTSGDPIGTMNAMIKSKMKRAIYKGAKWIITTPFKLAKKLAEKDAALGKALRGQLGKFINGESLLQAPFRGLKALGNSALGRFGSMLYGKTTTAVKNKATSSRSGFFDRLDTLINGPGRVMGKVKDAGNSTIKTFADLFGIKKQNAFDRDGSGERDGSWKDKFKKMYTNKKDVKEEDLKKEAGKTDGNSWFQWLPMIGIAINSIKNKALKFFSGFGTSIASAFKDAAMMLLTPFSSMFKMIGKVLGIDTKGLSLFGKEASKGAAKAAGKSGAKFGLKALGKSALKKIPGLGILAGLGFGINSFINGDVVGGIGNIASGLLSSIPGIGTAASFALDAWLASRDTGTSETETSSPNTTGQPDSAINTQNKNQKSIFSKAWDFMSGSDDETQPREQNNNATIPNGPSSLPMRTGPLYPPDGGVKYLVLGKGVKLDGMNPTMLSALSSMANEYYSITGKSIPINSGYRSTKDQQVLFNKFGNKAAKPGRSLHEFGLAFDTNTETANELDKLGLLRKYGFTRPVGKETWHVEPAGIQTDIQAAKHDPVLAAQLVTAGIGRGGDGWGTKNNVGKYTRNKQYQNALMTINDSLISDDNKVTTQPPKIAKEDMSNLSISPDSEREQKLAGGSPRQRHENLDRSIAMGQNKINTEVAKNTFGTNKRLDDLNTTLATTHKTNEEMLELMRELVTTTKDQKEKGLTVTVQTDDGTNKPKEVAKSNIKDNETPVINVKRKTYETQAG